MGRMYSVVFEGVTVSAVQDLFELRPAAEKPCIVHEVHITQDADETSQQLPVRCRRLPATVTSGSGGTTPTATPLNSSDAACSATVEANNTTAATTSGTALTLRRAGDNVLNGWHWVFTPETRPIVKSGEAFVVNLPSAPSAGIAMSGELIFEEL